jgi:aquaporin Z
MYNSRKLVAEFIGTFWLVLGGCGAAVLAAGVADVGIGWAGVSLAFGLTVLTGAYAFGQISGAHFNPAVTFGIFVAGRMPARDVIPYWVAQVLGGLAAGGVLYMIANGGPSFDPTAGFAANGYGDHSPQHYSMEAGAICEIVMTFMFLMVILGVTSYKEPAGFAPLAIGLALTLIHLISIPVTNTSVNPARSMGVAFFQGDWAIQQLWFFWVMPMIGAGLAGLVQRWLSAGDRTLVDSKM